MYYGVDYETRFWGDSEEDSGMRFKEDSAVDSGVTLGEFWSLEWILV